VAPATRTSPDPAESEVFFAQDTGITLFLAIARSLGSVNATLLQVGTPHFLDEVAATGSNAEHRDHREGLQQAVRRAFVNRPAARRLLSGRPDFVATVANQLADAGVPARMTRKGRFWGTRNTAPATTSSPPDRWQAWSGWMSKGLGHPRRCPAHPPRRRSQRT
jgi:hypothetical protein